jgi:hypothetical protein
MAKTREEEIRAYTIGELKPLTAPILVSNYDPGTGNDFVAHRVLVLTLVRHGEA